MCIYEGFDKLNNDDSRAMKDKETDNYSDVQPSNSEDYKNFRKTLIQIPKLEVTQKNEPGQQAKTGCMKPQTSKLR